MAEEIEVGCARPTGGPVGEGDEEEINEQKPIIPKEVISMIHVGKKVPDFAAPGYQQGKFISASLMKKQGSRTAAVLLSTRMGWSRATKSARRQ